MSGEAELQRMLRKIRSIPGLAKRSAPACAASLHEALSAELAAGRAPDGDAWAPRKDGSRALERAGERATRTVAVGATIITTTRDHYWAHNRGTSKVPQRRIVPTKLTPKLATAIKRPLVEAFDREVRRG